MIPTRSSARSRPRSVETGKPTLLCCRTTIGFGSPDKAGKESSHGAPLGKDEVVATRKALRWPHAPFEIPQAIRDGWRSQQQRHGAKDSGMTCSHDTPRSIRNSPRS